MAKRTRMTMLVVASLCAAAPAWAGPDGDGLKLGTVLVEGARPDDAAAPDPDRVPFVTIVDARSPPAGVASVADLIANEVGVQVRSHGGLGAPAALSLRGSDESEVAIFIDGVPLSRAASGAIDLSLLPVDGLDHVEIYRGVPPIELGSQAIGGAINLVTRKGSRGRHLSAAAGAGSFGARSLQASYGATLGRLRAFASAAYRGASGHFSYYDNGGTLLDRSDDHRSIRQNDGFDQLALDTEVGAGRSWRWTLGAHGFWKDQGVPGLGTSGAESLHARLSSSRLLVDGKLTHLGRRADLHLSTDFAFERFGFVNPYGEAVGNFGPAASDAQSLSAGLHGRVDLPLGTHQLLSLLAEARLERRLSYDILQPSRSGLPGLRGLGALAIADEVRLLRDRIALVPALRLDAAASSLSAEGGAAPTTARARTDWFLSPRLSLRIRATDWLTLRGSAGRFVRFPTLLELYGDGAFLLGTPTLAPEAAWGGDLGAAFAVHRRRFALDLEATLFGRRVTDLIAYVPAAYAATAVNVGDAQVLGGEARLSVRAWSLLRGEVSYTLLDALNLSGDPGAFGKQLPGRPRHKVDARISLLAGPFRVSYSLDFVDQVYRDAQNRNPIPGRVLHALSAELDHGMWSFRVDVENLADLRVVPLPLGGTLHQGETTPYPLVDFFDYPLPGRAFYATLALRH